MEGTPKEACLQPWLDSLLYLEPKNVSAFKTMVCNPGRVIELDRAADIRIKVLRIKFDEPNQRRGLVIFGRHPRSGVRLNDLKVASEHCFIDINPSSGELLLCDTSRSHQTYLDDEPVANPASRAMVYRRAKFLRIRAAIFEIHWPPVPRDRLQEYSRFKIAAGRRLRDDPDRLFTLTDLEWDVDSVPSTVLSTRRPTRSSTPFADRPPGTEAIIINIIGQGSFGVVYKAVNRYTAEPLAVKEIAASHISKVSLIGSFEREIQMMKDLRHVGQQ